MVILHHETPSHSHTIAHSKIYSAQPRYGFLHHRTEIASQFSRSFGNEKVRSTSYPQGSLKPKHKKSRCQLKLVSFTLWQCVFGGSYEPSMASFPIVPWCAVSFVGPTHARAWRAKSQ